MTLTLAPTSLTDLEASWEIYAHYFGDEGLGKREDCYSLLKCPYSCWTLKDDGQIIGGFSLFSLSSAFLSAILAGQRFDSEITFEDVLPFKQGEPAHLYLAAGAVDASLPAHARKFYAGRLAGSFASVICLLYEQGYTIEAIYGLAVTAEGEQIISRIGFTPLGEIVNTYHYKPYSYAMTEQGLKRLRSLRRLAPALLADSPDAIKISSEGALPVPSSL
ncbi:hypothetical protein EPA93_09140 [Ktedonosporobacter rubrisoli]|uniref:GNAT family N-acetyltransferase n=1 Tax=Ktedonosporobacter rubrisoli TaxID=2509675 RepID=A0A4P6JLS7_KTERU|nr:hypothetical protein [Ktedonosporobacter rubrisoli]QBD76164.1 hypothetical protein EPA93_09140 [Ktedonosporobacter rubrisoli]